MLCWGHKCGKVAVRMLRPVKSPGWGCRGGGLLPYWGNLWAMLTAQGGEKWFGKETGKGLKKKSLNLGRRKAWVVRDW